jgi:5-methyltetrahydrofolate--homocysteine methyltransferase
MTNRFLERLQAGDVLIADGAIGTNLQIAGLKPGASPEDWVFDQPEKVVALHRAFAEAGSDLILTDTFGGTYLRLKGSPYADRAAEMNRRAAALAREASATRAGALIGGSMGPTGILLQPFGPLKYGEAVTAYADQAKALADGGVDLLVIETYFALDEAKAAVEGAQRATSLPIVVSFSFDRGVRTMMGVKPAQVAATFKPLGVAAVGANCGTTLDNMLQIVQEYAAADSGFPIWAKPNAGLPVTHGDRAVYEITPEQMGEYAVRFVQAGARIAGGCCGSTPAHVAAIARAAKHIAAK